MSLLTVTEALSPPDLLRGPINPRDHHCLRATKQMVAGATAIENTPLGTGSFTQLAKVGSEYPHIAFGRARAAAMLATSYVLADYLYRKHMLRLRPVIARLNTKAETVGSFRP